MTGPVGSLERDDPARADAGGRRPPPSPASGAKPRLPRRRVFVGFVLLVAALVAIGAYRHWTTSAQADRTQAATVDFEPRVSTQAATADDRPIKLTLPGQTEAFFTATIYPRATGYVAERRVDIGSHVKKGDVLLRIASAELDAELAQAKGQLQQVQAALGQAQAQVSRAKASLDLANVTSKRFNTLAQEGYATEQKGNDTETSVETDQAQLDDANASVKVAEANIQAQQGTVDHLAALVSYEVVSAPFDGYVVTRGVEIGDLVTADSKSGAPLFTLASDNVLRVSVFVPQENAFAMHDGLPATAYLPQRPEQTFSGHVARSSGSLIDASRVLNTQIDVLNPTGELKPGVYVDVTFDLPRSQPRVVVPASALIFDQAGIHVAVAEGGRVRMAPITIYRDLGDRLELRDGLKGGEAVIVNPPVNLKDGMKVRAEPVATTPT